MGLVYQTLEKLVKVIQGIPETERYLHSDQGVHYTHPTFQKKVEAMGLTQSMSRRGTAGITFLWSPFLAT